MRSDKLSTNYIFNLLNRIVILVIPLITTPYLTRVLGSEELGLFNYANTIALYYVMVAMMGMTILGNKRISLARTENAIDKEFSSLISIQVFNTIVCVIAYLVYIAVFCKANKIIAFIQLFYLLSAMFDVTWFWQGLEKFKYIAIRNVFVNTITTALIFLFVRKSEDIVIYTVIKCVSILISQLVLVFSCIKEVHWVKPNRNDIKITYKQLLVFFIPVAAESIFHNMDRVMLGAMVGYSAVAIYYTSRMITDIPQCLVTSINTIMYPRVTALVGKKKDEDASSLTYYSFVLINAVCVAMAFGVAAIAKDFVAFYLGADYQYCAISIPWLAPYIVLAAWNGTIRYQCLLPKSMEKVYSKAIVMGIVCNLLLNALLIGKLGVIGAILATIISELVTAIIQTVPVYNEMRIKNHLINIIVFCISGVLMYFVVDVISKYLSINIIAKVMMEIIGGIMVYVPITLIGIMIVDKNIKSIIRNKLRKG